MSTLAKIAKLGWSEERIRKAIADNQHANGRQTKAYVGGMNPRDFAPSTTPRLDDLQTIRNETKPLNLEELRAETQTPYMSTDGNQQWRHEGRHRSEAMANAGVEEAPVIFKGDYYSEHDPRRPLIQGNDSTYAFEPEDPIALTDANFDRIMKRFGQGTTYGAGGLAAIAAGGEDSLANMGNEIPTLESMSKGAHESQAIPVPNGWRGNIHDIGTWLQQNLDHPLGGTWFEGLGDYMTDLAEGQKKTLPEQYWSGLMATLDIAP